MSGTLKNMIKCDKCKRFFDSNSWERGKTYKGIDKHHNPPTFFSKVLKKSWSGEIYNLCRKCHRELHNNIIKILNKKIQTLKFINSEHWILKKMNLKQIKEAEKEIYQFTKEWIKNE